MFCERDEVAVHRRSWVKADVVLAATHARELRLAREAKAALTARDQVVDFPDLTVYDGLAG